MVTTHLQGVLHLPLLLLLTLWGSRVSADSGCLLDSVREKSCSARLNNTDTSVRAEKKGRTGGEVSWVSCDFSQDRCSFSAGCPSPDEAATPWTRRQASHHWFMETRVNGSEAEAKSPSWESPLLHFPLPSCLTFTASTAKDSVLTVFLLDPHTNCTVGTKRVTAPYTQKSFQLNVPAGPTQIVFQGSGRGNATNTIRLYSLSTQPQCCTDEDWWSMSRAQIAQQSLPPDCRWTIEHWNNRDNFGNGSVATHSPSENSITSPVLNATSAGGHVGCLSFKFVLQKDVPVSLSISLLVGPSFQDPVPKWRFHTTGVNNGSGFSLDFTQGQLPVSIQQSFRVQFRAHSAGTAVVIVNNVSYSRTNSTACPLLPADATVTPQGEEDSNAVLVAVIAALASAVLVSLLVLCVCVCCRQLQRKLETSRSCEKDDQDIIMTAAERPVCTTADSPPSDGHYHTLETPSANSHSTVQPQEAEETYDNVGHQADGRSAVYDRAGTNNGGTSAPHKSLGENPEMVSPVYDKLGEVKQGKAAKARERTLRVYDHVGPVNEAVYDVTQRDTRLHVIGVDYDHLNRVFPHKSA